MLLSSEAKQKGSSECWPRAQELSPVTSSATFYAVLSTWGVWGGGTCGEDATDGMQSSVPRPGPVSVG